MKDQVLVHNYKTKEAEWIDCTIIGSTIEDVGEDLDRIDVITVNGVYYYACHPDCIRQV